MIENATENCLRITVKTRPTTVMYRYELNAE